MIFDTHVHTEISSDSTMPLEAALAQAKRLDLGIITTEHMDFDYCAGGQFVFDVDSYFARYAPYRGDNYLLGIEIGMQSSCLPQNKRLATEYNFDYIIGSLHLIDGIDLYYEEYYRQRSKRESYETYLENMARQLSSHAPYIDSLGHIDYIARYARYDDRQLYYDEYAGFIDSVLQLLIDNDIAIELNTRRLDDKTNINELAKIYRRYGQMGGRNVTIGSDAHNQAAIGGNFAAALTLVKNCGLAAGYFKERQFIVMAK